MRKRQPYQHIFQSLPLRIFLAVIIHVKVLATAAQGEVFRDCGGDVQSERGFIQSPNFPDPFPDPISCTWILRARPGKKIQLYFTQYFLRDSFSLSEFDSYTSPHIFQGRSDLGVFDFSEHVTSVVGYKPVLTIEFHARSKTNIHLRVEEFLNSVYGFNITYEMVDKAASLRTNTCSVHECSFLGHCVAASDWSSYYCDCFPGYYGNECQYGPHCDPKAGKNMCLNGGSCRYFYGSLVNMCDCPPGFTGVQCETPTDSEPSELGGKCSKLGCSQLCEKKQHEDFACGCRKGFILDEDNKSCQLIKMHRIQVDVLTRDIHVTGSDITSRKYELTARRQMNALMRFYGLPRPDRFSIDGFRPNNDGEGGVLSFHFYTESESVERVELLLSILAMRGRIFNLNTTYDDVHVRSVPELQLLSVEHFERRAAPEGGYANLICRARGSGQTEFRWFKDGQAFNTSMTARNMWQTYIPEASGQSHLSILNINDITIYDRGEFTCEVEDFGEVQRQSVHLKVKTAPRVIVTPLAASIDKGDKASFRCFSPDERQGAFNYRWLKNGEELSHGGHPEITEDLQPRGKSLFVPYARQSANYTCVIKSDASTSTLTVHLFVGENKERCPGEKTGNITWESALDGGLDVQKCPPNMAGLASRACRCADDTCTWSEPNLARCQTPSFIAAFDRMEQVRHGYQGESISTILTHVLDLLRNRGRDVIAGDITLASRILLNGLSDALDIPDQLMGETRRLQPEVVFSLADRILDLALNVTPEEKEEQRLFPRTVVTLEILSELMGWAMPLPQNGTYKGQFLDVSVLEVVSVEPDGHLNNTKTQLHEEDTQKISAGVTAKETEQPPSSSQNQKNRQLLAERIHINVESDQTEKRKQQKDIDRLPVDRQQSNQQGSFSQTQSDDDQNSDAHQNKQNPVGQQNQQSSPAQHDQKTSVAQQNQQTSLAQQNQESSDTQQNQQNSVTHQNSTTRQNQQKSLAQQDQQNTIAGMPSAAEHTSVSSEHTSVPSNQTHRKLKASGEFGSTKITPVMTLASSGLGSTKMTPVGMPGGFGLTKMPPDMPPGSSGFGAAATETPYTSKSTTGDKKFFGPSYISDQNTADIVTEKPHTVQFTTAGNIFTGTFDTTEQATVNAFTKASSSAEQNTVSMVTEAYYSASAHDRAQKAQDAEHPSELKDIVAKATSTKPSLQDDKLVSSDEEEEGSKPFRLMEIVHASSLKLLHLPQASDSSKFEWAPLSGLRSLLPVGESWETHDFRLNVTFHHPRKAPLFEPNETSCLAIATVRRTFDQFWVSDVCEVLHHSQNVTTCRCILPAHVALFIRAREKPEKDKEEDRPGSAVLFVGSVLALCGVTGTLLAYLVACRRSWSVIHCVRFNFILSLFAVLVLCVMCLQGRHFQILCLTGRLLLHLFLLGAYSFLFVDSLHMYVMVHAISTRVLRQAWWKFLLIGWGIPALSVGSTALSSHYHNQHSDSCYHWCWVESSRWQFYPFLVPMLVLVLACVVISVICMLTVSRWTDEWRFNSRKKHMLRTAKNGSLLLALLGVTWTGSAAETVGSYAMQSVFLLFLFVLVAAVFIAYCATENQVMEVIINVIKGRSRRQAFRQTLSTNSFRAFIMPEKILGQAETIHRFCTEIDNSKYTSAKKRQLRFLLGTSSGSESDDFGKQVFLGGRRSEEGYLGMGSRFGRVDGYIAMDGYMGMRLGEQTDTAADSGVFVASDSEKSSSCGRHGST